MRPKSREARGDLKSQLYGIRIRLADTEADIASAEARGEIRSSLYRRRKMLEIEAGYCLHYLSAE